VERGNIIQSKAENVISLAAVSVEKVMQTWAFTIKDKRET
jgi:hypothetical protein